MGQISSSSSSSAQRKERIIVLLVLCHGIRTDTPFEYNKTKLLHVLSTVEKCNNYSSDNRKAEILSYSTNLMKKYQNTNFRNAFSKVIGELKDDYIKHRQSEPRNLSDGKYIRQLDKINSITSEDKRYLSQYEIKSLDKYKVHLESRCNGLKKYCNDINENQEKFFTQPTTIINKRFTCMNESKLINGKRQNEKNRGMYIIFDTKSKDQTKQRRIDLTNYVTTEEIYKEYKDHYDKIILLDYSCDGEEHQLTEMEERTARKIVTDGVVKSVWKTALLKKAKEEEEAKQFKNSNNSKGDNSDIEPDSTAKSTRSFRYSAPGNKGKRPLPNHDRTSQQRSNSSRGESKKRRVVTGGNKKKRRKSTKKNRKGKSTTRKNKKR